LTEKSVHFVGGGIETLPGLARARALGFGVSVSDRNPDAPCMREADRAVVADTYDAGATIVALDKAAIRPDGVLCLGTDVPVTVALVADHFGLPGLSLETARAAADKLKMKDLLLRHGVAIPWYGLLSSADELEMLMAAKPWPLVVKPVDSRGARGVILMGPDVDPTWAFACARGYSPTQRVMAEQYLPGPQVSTESLVVDGRVHTPGFSDRNYGLLERYAPFFIEDGGDLPGTSAAPIRAELIDLVAAAARAMGVVNGVVKGDLVYCDGKPYVIEVATRLSGGYFCTHSIPVSTGVDLVGQAIRQALGLPVDEAALVPDRNVAVCQRYLFPEPGRVTSVRGLEAARALPGVFHAEVRVRAGDRVEAVSNHPGRAGVVMAEGQTGAEARTRVEEALATIEIRTE